MADVLYVGQFSTITGHKHAGRLGIPTLNLNLEGYALPVETGIYAGYTVIEGTRYPSAIHYGPRPMLGDGALSLETHLIDAQLDEAPANVAIELLARLRSIEEFPDEPALVAQVRRDIEEARRILEQPAA